MLFPLVRFVEGPRFSPVPSNNYSMDLPVVKAGRGRNREPPARLPPVGRTLTGAGSRQILD